MCLLCCPAWDLVFIVVVLPLVRQSYDFEHDEFHGVKTGIELFTVFASKAGVLWERLHCLSPNALMVKGQ